MKKTILYAAFSLATVDQCEEWLSHHIGGATRLNGQGFWRDDNGVMWREPSYVFIMFGLDGATRSRIADWFRANTNEQSLLWENAAGEGKFEALRGSVEA